METATFTEALVVKRTFTAPPERVFRAWTNPKFLTQWFHMTEEWSTPICEVDLRVGGRYRLGMKNPGADAPYVATGLYREIVENEKLVFTWEWEGSEPCEMLVTVNFHNLDGSTEVELIHERFLDNEQRDKHREGWEGLLVQLSNIEI